MGSAEFIAFSGAAELVERVAKDWLDLIRSHPCGQPFCVALPGGRITSRLFATFVSQVKNQAIDLAPVHFFWSDERCVPPTSVDSNFLMAREHLLEPLQIAAGNIHRIPAEMSSLAAAAEAESGLRQVLASQEPMVPSMKLVFLGMGEDGHVASLFPGEDDDLSNDARIFRLVNSPKPPPLRVTLGYPAIAAAREVWVVASGPGKEVALQKSLEDRSTPLGRVLNLRPSTRVYSDISRKKN